MSVSDDDDDVVTYLLYVEVVQSRGSCAYVTLRRARNEISKYQNPKFNKMLTAPLHRTYWSAASHITIPPSQHAQTQCSPKYAPTHGQQRQFA